jgi:hypothetical protein
MTKREAAMTKREVAMTGREVAMTGREAEMKGNAQNHAELGITGIVCDFFQKNRLFVWRFKIKDIPLRR